MKKTLLFASAMAIVAASASAAVLKDPASYAAKEGFTCENLWLYSNFIPTGEMVETPEGLVSATGNFTDLPFGNSNYARTACIYEDKVVVAFTDKIIDGDKTIDRASYCIFGLESGEYLGQVYPTLDGKYIEVGAPLCSNSIGVDDFGHLWFAPYRASLYTTNEESGEVTINPVYVYYVSDVEKGICQQYELYVDEDAATDAKGPRVDYIDLVGDVTGEECHTVVLATSDGDSNYVWGWKREQGEDEFGKFFGRYFNIVPSETFPADVTSWASAGVVYIARDEDSTGELFYVDSWVTCPVLYNADGGEAIDGFQNAESELCPKVGTNGICEFNLGGIDFVAYSVNQYVAPDYCTVNICQLGEGMSFAAEDGMHLLWTVPEGGMGDATDGGNRVHSLRVKKFVDDNGNEAVDVLTYKCRNGLGVYRVAQEGFDAGVNDILVEGSNAPVEYFNLQGVRVPASNLTKGIYVTRQGNKASKVLVK